MTPNAISPGWNTKFQDYTTCVLKRSNYLDYWNQSRTLNYRYASLNDGIRSEKCVVRRFRRCANVIQCTYTNPDSI